MQELFQISGTLVGLGLGELRVGRFDVFGAFDGPEHTDRGGTLAIIGQPTQSKRNRGVRRRLVVDDECVDPYIVDIDDSWGAPRPTLRLVPDRTRLEALGVSDREVLDSIGAAFGGQLVGYAHRGEGRDPLEISVRLPQNARTWPR